MDVMNNCSIELTNIENTSEGLNTSSEGIVSISNIDDQKGLEELFKENGTFLFLEYLGEFPEISFDYYNDDVVLGNILKISPLNTEVIKLHMSYRADTDYTPVDKVFPKKFFPTSTTVKNKILLCFQNNEDGVGLYLFTPVSQRCLFFTSQSSVEFSDARKKIFISFLQDTKILNIILGKRVLFSSNENVFDVIDWRKGSSKPFLSKIFNKTDKLFNS